MAAKITMVGECSVGKTSILKCYMTGGAVEEGVSTTMGVGSAVEEGVSTTMGVGSAVEENVLTTMILGSVGNKENLAITTMLGWVQKEETCSRQKIKVHLE